MPVRTVVVGLEERLGAQLGFAILALLDEDGDRKNFAVGPELTFGEALLVIDDLWHSLGVAGFVLLMVGGLLHTVGAVVYATRRPNPWPRWFGFHEVFHVFVIAAIAAHYVVVATIALPMAA